MHFEYSYVLYFLIIPALFILLAYRMKRQRSRQWELLVAPKLITSLVHIPSKGRQIIAFLLAIIGLSLLIISAARPQWGEEDVEETPRSRNLLVAIDISRSMLTPDVQPSRIDQAKTIAYDLLDEFPEDRMGLIVFSGDATLVVPLTHDHNAIRETIEQLHYSWAGQGGTNFNEVIKLALDTFKRNEGSNALILLSDGENTEPLEPNITKEALRSHLIVVAGGIGTQTGATIPDPSSPDGLYRDRSGQHVISKFDPKSMQLLAEETQGSFALITSGQSINTIVKDVAKRLDVQEGEAQSTRKLIERFQLFLLPALICLILALLIAAQWKKTRPMPLTALILALGLISLQSVYAQNTLREPDKVSDLPALPQLPQNGLSKNGTDSTVANDINKPLSEKEAKELAQAEAMAKQITEGLSITDEDNPYSAYLKAYTGHSLGIPDSSIEGFSRALLSPEKKMQAESHYNIGTLLTEKTLNDLKKQFAPTPSEGMPQPQPQQQGKFDYEKPKGVLREAIQHFDETLKLTPNHPKALKNKSIAEQLIKKLEEQEKQEQQNQDQNKEDQQKQDQNKDQQQKDQQDQNKDQQNQDNKDKQDQQNNKDQQNQDNKDQQDQQDQNKDQQDKNQQGKDQQDQGKQDQQDQQGQDQQQKDQQDKNQQGKDQQDKDQQGENKDDQQKQDQQQGQEGKDQQEQQGDQKDQQDQNKEDQGKQDQQEKDQPGDKGDQKKDQQPQPGEDEKGDQKEEVAVGEGEEKEGTPDEKGKALRILKERSDLEKGAPFLKKRYNYRPEKDW